MENAASCWQLIIKEEGVIYISSVEDSEAVQEGKNFLVKGMDEK